jgi:hypothetical protein
MEFVYYTAAGLILYFLSDWILRKVEQMRGEAFEQRTLIFFVIILVRVNDDFLKGRYHHNRLPFACSQGCQQCHKNGINIDFRQPLIRSLRFLP